MTESSLIGYCQKKATKKEMSLVPQLSVLTVAALVRAQEEERGGGSGLFFRFSRCLCRNCLDTNKVVSSQIQLSCTTVTTTINIFKKATNHTKLIRLPYL